MKIRNTFRVLLVPALMALCASVESAATITFTGVNGVSDGRDYVGPYSIQIDGTSFQTMCYDLTDNVGFGQVWQANLLPLDQLAGAYFSAQLDYQVSYQKEAWLLSQLLIAGDPGTQIDIQHAAWSLFDMSSFREDLNAAAWRAAAQTAFDHGFPGLNLTEFRAIESPAGEARVQGLIVSGFPTVINGQSVPVQSFPDPGLDPTPEPGTFVMLGCGVVMLGVYRARRH